MSDLISRKAVNKIIDKWLSNPFYELKDHIYEMTKKIHELPSVENKGEPTYYPPCIDCNKKMDEIRRTYDKLKEIPSVENKGEWIPISSINEIPKEGAYWVTFEYKNGYRETSHIGWDTFHKYWDDEEGWALDDGDYIIAYMPYFEPKPYNPKGEQ